MNKTIGALFLTAITLYSINYYLQSHSDMPNLERIAYLINKDQDSTWKAQNYPRFTYNRAQLKRMFNLQVESSLPSEFDEAPVHDDFDLPENFDAREQWPECESIREVRDQSSCGSCWAFGAVTAMSDRICIASGQTNQTRVSSEDLMECCSSCGSGCNGGYLYQSWAYWKRHGIVTGDLYDDKNSCKPYNFPPCSHHVNGPYESCDSVHYHTPRCKRACTNQDYTKSYSDDAVYGTRVYSVYGETQMMKELVQHGSLEAAFSVYEDFLTYKSGVYQNRHGYSLGGHAIRIIGYGVENGVKYWLCVNSWNETWGDNGTFKILRGSNHCGIEDDVVGGLPQL